MFFIRKGYLRVIKQKRIDGLVDELKKNNINAIFLGPSSDLEYVAELSLFADERTKGLMVTAEGEAFALTPLLYREDMARVLGEQMTYQVWEDHNGFTGAFRSGCETLQLAGKRIAINDGVIAVDLLEMMKAVPAEYLNGGHLLDPVRRRKDQDELETMREASRIVDRVMERVSGALHVGMTEGDLLKQLPAFFESEGAEGMSFNPIVAAGANGSMPHYSGGSKVIEKGDFVVVDMGARYKGYCSDTTRTFCMGAPSNEQCRIYNIVLEAQKAGEAAVKAGCTGQDVDRAARSVITSAGYGDFFLNRLGHGIGVAIHEAPYIIEGNETPLEPGNVFSVEPGIYIPGKFGVRIENLVAVRSDGSGEPLNHYPREMIVIEA